MKKFLLSIALVLPLASLASDYGVHVPEWEDFVPPAFVDIQEPKKLGKLNIVASYWYKRKVEFEKELETCKQLEDIDARLTCYEDLKVNQFQQNTNRE